jgi:hypothetical protein
VDVSGWHVDILGSRRRLRPAPKRWAAVAVATGLLVLAGCGPDRPVTVEVTGKVTLDGKPFDKPGTLYFTPIEPAAGLPSRPGRADFGADGLFTARTFQEGDGLIPGRYGVAVDCWDSYPTPENPHPKSYVPKKYANAWSNDLEVVVAPGDGPQHVELDLNSAE